MARPRTVTDDRLLDAAADVLAEVGPASFTLARAADRARVAPATYVKRFGSRRAVFLALNARWADGIDPALEAASSGRDGVDALRAAVLTGVAEMDEPAHAANQLATLALDLADPEMQAYLDRGWAALHDHVTDLLRRLLADGRLPSAPPADQAGRMLVAVVEGTRIAWCVRPEGSLLARVESHVDALLTAWERPAVNAI